MMTSEEISKYNNYVERLKEYVNRDWDVQGGECDALDLVITHFRESVEIELNNQGFANIDDTNEALDERKRAIINRKKSVANDDRLERINCLFSYVNDSQRFYRNMFFYIADGLKYLRPLREDELLKLIDKLATRELEWLKDMPDYERIDQRIE